MVENSINNVSNSFKTAVGMPWCSLWFTRRVFNFTHLIHHDEWIQLSHIDSSKSSTYRKAFAFIPLWRCCNALDRARACANNLIHTRQNSYIGNGYSWHFITPWLASRIIEDSTTCKLRNIHITSI